MTDQPATETPGQTPLDRPVRTRLSDDAVRGGTSTPEGIAAAREAHVRALLGGPLVSADRLSEVIDDDTTEEAPVASVRPRTAIIARLNRQAELWEGTLRETESVAIREQADAAIAANRDGVTALQTYTDLAAAAAALTEGAKNVEAPTFKTMWVHDYRAEMRLVVARITGEEIR